MGAAKKGGEPRRRRVASIDMHDATSGPPPSDPPSVGTSDPEVPSSSVGTSANNSNNNFDVGWRELQYPHQSTTSSSGDEKPTVVTLVRNAFVRLIRPQRDDDVHNNNNATAGESRRQRPVGSAAGRTLAETTTNSAEKTSTTSRRHRLLQFSLQRPTDKQDIEDDSESDDSVAGKIWAFCCRRVCLLILLLLILIISGVTTVVVVTTTPRGSTNESENKVAGGPPSPTPLFPETA